MEIGLGNRRKYPIFVRSETGEARETLHFPFDELTLQNQLLALHNALLRSGGAWRVALSSREQTVQNFGRALFEALFIGEVRSRYVASQLSATNQSKGLRLKLHIQSPELAALPWEFMYDPNQAKYLGLSSYTPLVRYLELPQSPQPLSVTPPLQILGMAVGPKDLANLDIDGEKLRVEKAIENLRANGLIELTWIQGQTWQDLQREMRHGPWHVFHFIGHGDFDTLSDQGLIALADNTGKAQLLKATQLGMLLADHRALRLVVLNSCEGARNSERDIISSTASIIVQQGIPAVLAMQYEITDHAAIVLSHAFYEALADGWPVDAAISEARKAISLDILNTFEWGTPVLYMRSPNGMLFDVVRKTPSSLGQSGDTNLEKEVPLSTSVFEYKQDVERPVMTRDFIEGKNISIDSTLSSTISNKVISKAAQKDNIVLQSSFLKAEPQNTLQGHTGPVFSVAFSPDGRMLASGGQDESVRIWKVIDGKTLRILEGHKDQVHCVNFAPNGQILASGSDDKTVRLWRVADGTGLHILKGHTNRVNAVAFSPQDQILASGSGDNTVRLWQTTSCMPIDNMPILEHSSMIHGITFSPDGQILASGSGYLVSLWRMTDGVLLHTLKGHINRVNTVAFTPDGQIMATGSDDKTVRLWRVIDGAFLYTLEGHSRGVSSVAFTLDGQILASASDDTTIRLWSVPDRTLLDILYGHANWVNSVAFSSSEQILASGSSDKTIRMWKLSYS